MRGCRGRRRYAAHRERRSRGGSPCAVCQGAKEGAKSVHTRNQSRIDVGLCTHIDEKAKFKYFIVETELCTPKYPVSRFSILSREKMFLQNRDTN